jgi:hypothetical protein
MMAELLFLLMCGLWINNIIYNFYYYQITKKNYLASARTARKITFSLDKIPTDIIKLLS